MICLILLSSLHVRCSLWHGSLYEVRHSYDNINLLLLQEYIPLLWTLIT